MGIFASSNRFLPDTLKNSFVQFQNSQKWPIATPKQNINYNLSTNLKYHARFLFWGEMTDTLVQNYAN